MKRTLFSLLFCSGVLCVVPSAGLAQMIPLWTQKVPTCEVTSNVPPCGTRDTDELRKVTMVGRNPFLHGHIKTTIKTYLISVKLQFADTGLTFDPTLANDLVDNDKEPISVQQATADSPIFQNAAWTMNGTNIGSGVVGGMLQYVDAFQRANFWQYVGGTPYQTVLSPLMVTDTDELTLPANLMAKNGVITVPAMVGSSMKNCNGNPNWGPCGRVDEEAFDLDIARAIINQNPKILALNTFPIFILDSVQLTLPAVITGEPDQVICGYHSSFVINNGSQTYAVADFDTSGALADSAPDVECLSHEVAEWMDDPIVNGPTQLTGEGGEGGNQVAPWGPYGQVPVGSCQSNLEVGDPSSQKSPIPPVNGGKAITPKSFVKTLNNFTYHLQELNYFSWFLGGPLVAVDANQFSNNGSFTENAGVICGQ